MEKKSKIITVKDIAMIGMMTAVIEVCKAAMLVLPNIELTSFWLIMFTIFFGWKILLVVPVFVLIEGIIFGINVWWISYLYVWPILVLAALLFRKQKSVWFWCILSAVFGLAFGFMCAIPYVFIGASDGGLMNGLRVAGAWWVAGIPWDIMHGVSNFVLMLILYYPIRNIMKRVRFLSTDMN